MDGLAAVAAGDCEWHPPATQRASKEATLADSRRELFRTTMVKAPCKRCRETGVPARVSPAAEPGQMPGEIVYLRLWPEIALFRHALAHLCIHLRVTWLPGCQAVYVAVVHAESSRDQHRIVNLHVGGSLCPSFSYMLLRDTFAIDLNLFCDCQQ